jgi:prephenate dehydrogenase
MAKRMKIKIIGNGVFGSFLRELLAPHCEFADDAQSVILAVPISAFHDVGAAQAGKHLVNVCSVQKPSTDILLGYSDQVTSIHPLFGPRTPADKRNAILTFSCTVENDTWITSSPEFDVLKLFRQVCAIQTKLNGQLFSPETHDQLMAKTHLAAMLGAKQMQVFVERAKQIPDELVPNSFRLLRQFVQTLDDMPPGTRESILANPYI